MCLQYYNKIVPGSAHRLRLAFSKFNYCLKKEKILNPRQLNGFRSVRFSSSTYTYTIPYYYDLYSAVHAHRFWRFAVVCDALWKTCVGRESWQAARGIPRNVLTGSDPTHLTRDCYRYRLYIIVFCTHTHTPQSVVSVRPTATEILVFINFHKAMRDERTKYTRASV